MNIGVIATAKSKEEVSMPRMSLVLAGAALAAMTSCTTAPPAPAGAEAQARLQQLLAQRPDPKAIAREAQLFGQEDDISVVSMKWIGRAIDPSAEAIAATSGAIVH